MAESQEFTQETLKTHDRSWVPCGRLSYSGTRALCTNPGHANDHLERKQCLLNLSWSRHLSSNSDKRKGATWDT